MKLLTFRDTSTHYGAEVHMLRVARGAAQRGVEVHAAFPRAPGTATMIRECEVAGIAYWPFELTARFGLLPPDKSLSPCLQMLRLLGAVRPDVVQITTGWPDEIWPPALACALRNTPVLAVFQLAPQAVWLPRLRRMQLAWARRRRQRWMAVSQQNRSTLLQTFEAGPDEIGILYNGTDIPDAEASDAAAREALRRDVRGQLALAADARVLLTGGRLHRQKGPFDLLEIVPRIVEQFPDVTFVWAGDGPERQALDIEVQRHGLLSHVRFLGYRSDMDRLLRAADLFVLPSHYEGGCSAVIREAMARRLPIVCSDAGGISEILHDGVHALMFHAQDPEGLLARLREALGDPAKMRSLAEQARRRIEEFSADRMVDNYLAVFRELWAPRIRGVCQARA